MTELSNAQYDEAIKEGIVLVAFLGEGCKPCDAAKEMLVKVEEEYKDRCKFYSVAAKGNREMNDKVGVKSVPTIIVYNKGVEAARRTGHSASISYGDMISRCISENR